MAFPISACAIRCLPQIEQVVQHVSFAARRARPNPSNWSTDQRIGVRAGPMCVPTSWTVNTDVFAHYDRQAVNSTSSGSFLAAKR
jgi:hypothetical protein